MDRIPSTPGIYAIRNLINGHIYVGSAVNLQKRRQSHFTMLKHGKHPNRHLKSAFAKYGEDAFAFEVLEHVQDKKNLIDREQHYIDTLKPAYNIAPKADSQIGVKRTEESRLRMSRPRSPEARARITEANHRAAKYRSKPSYTRPLGISHAPEVRIKIAKTLTGRKRPPEVVAKIADVKRGKKQRPRSEKAKQRMKEAQALRREKEAQQPKKPLTPEHRAKLSAANKGKHAHNKGKPAWNKGIPISEEQKTKYRMSRAKNTIARRIQMNQESMHDQLERDKDAKSDIKQLRLWDDII